MSDDAPKKAPPAGAPAWVMTFADLMSLLMCFFVLLLSFSEMDVAKYKQLAGSMKDAFGVQRDVEVKDMPRGVNIIAQEFSAGRPDPTPLNVVQQQTASEMQQFLDTGGKAPKPGEKGQPAGGREKAEAIAQGAKGEGGSEGSTGDLGSSAGTAGSQAQVGRTGKADKSARAGETAQDQLVMLPMNDALRALKAKEAAEREKKLQQSADEIRAALQDEIKAGAVDVETEYQKIVIRVREKAAFPSGDADMRVAFRPILDRVGQVLKETEGHITVSGHTDNIPITTSRFRSNWELAAARAVSVVHELIYVSDIPSERFTIEGLAETRPMAPNDSEENRARNRRVEIKLSQGDDLEAEGDIGAEPVAPEPAAVVEDEDPFVRN